MYHLVFGILYLISLLPFRVLYILSDIFYVILYRMIGYRKAVVMENLSFAFPEKSETERQEIADKFYRNFMDNWIETVKLISISRTTLNKRATGNYDVLHQLFPKGKAVQADFGHFFNWELMALHTVINQPYTL
ncbi:MAG: lysophospholipid acyltransferase family protein, partial [Flavisolibacter sp.]